MPTPATVSDLHILAQFWIEFCLIKPKPRPVNKRITQLKSKSIDHNAFSEDISKLNLAGSDVSDLVNQYDTEIAAVFDNHAPVTTKTIVVRSNTQWHNANLRHAKTVHRRLERRLQRTNSTEAKEAYMKQCYLVKHLRDEAKSEFLSNRVLECGRDQRCLFNVMKNS